MNPAARADILWVRQSKGGLAELVDALDSKSSSNECGFESHSRYSGGMFRRRGPFSALPNGMAGTRTIGIIAGSGVYPETFIRHARAKSPGIRLVVAAFHGETKPELADAADAMEWFRVGQLSKVVRFFRREGADEAVMMGRISPKKLFDLRPDLRVLMLLARIRERNAETLFGGIAEELAKDGITLLPATTFLEDLLPPAGHVCGPALGKRQLGDAEFGYRIAKETSAMDIGQSVVVRHGTVLAVEAFEGTNECIRRGGALGRGRNVLLVKVSKPAQDLRFDVPVIGPDTIETCAEAGVSAVVIEAGRTLVLEMERVARLCDKRGVSLQAIDAIFQ